MNEEPAVQRLNRLRGNQDYNYVPPEILRDRAIQKQEQLARSIRNNHRCNFQAINGRLPRDEAELNQYIQEIEEQKRNQIGGGVDAATRLERLRNGY